MQVLTLVSNERVPLSESIRMVFEINSLKVRACIETQINPQHDTPLT